LQEGSEFLFSDLSIVERRMERLARDIAKGKRDAQQQANREEFDLMMRLRENLEQEIPVRDVPLTPEEQKRIRGYQFLSAKPVLVVLNIGDEGSDDPADYGRYAHRQSPTICLRGALEMEIAQLAPEEAEAFLQEYGIEEPGLNRLIRLSYEMLGLHSFFTVGQDEVRAWTIPHGANAVAAAQTAGDQRVDQALEATDRLVAALQNTVTLTRQQEYRWAEHSENVLPAAQAAIEALDLLHRTLLRQLVLDAQHQELPLQTVEERLASGNHSGVCAVFIYFYLQIRFVRH